MCSTKNCTSFKSLKFNMILDSSKTGPGCVWCASFGVTIHFKLGPVTWYSLYIKWKMHCNVISSRTHYSLLVSEIFWKFLLDSQIINHLHSSWWIIGPAELGVQGVQVRPQYLAEVEVNHFQSKDLLLFRAPPNLQTFRRNWIKRLLMNRRAFVKTRYF